MNLLRNIQEDLRIFVIDKKGIYWFTYHNARTEWFFLAMETSRGGQWVSWAWYNHIINKSHVKLTRTAQLGMQNQSYVLTPENWKWGFDLYLQWKATNSVPEDDYHITNKRNLDFFHYFMELSS